MTIYSKVSELPDVLVRALKSVRYGKKDISISTAEKVCILGAGGAGRREFAILVNLETGTFETLLGSWGGSNMFNPTNPVDLDSNYYELPVNGAVIKGSEGESTFATITLHPNNMVKALPEKPELSELDRAILYAYGALKSGPYRKEQLERAGAKEQDVDSLVQRGLLKRTKVGVSITTEGKNARVKQS